MNTVDDFVKIVLVLSIAFTLVGITIQIIRMLGGFVETVKLSNSILKNMTVIVEKFTSDYDFLSEKIKFIVETVSKFVSGVLGPITKVASFVGSFTKDKDKHNKKASKDNSSDEDEE